jgi:hypothetical protein
MHFKLKAHEREADQYISIVTTKNHNKIFMKAQFANIFSSLQCCGIDT